MKQRLARDGRLVHVSLWVSPVHDMYGRVVGASKIARDIGDRKEAERLQELLVGELSHRVKNILASVQAIARQTLGPPEPGSSLSVFYSRLASLSKAHSLLTQAHWKSAKLQDVVNEAVSAYPAERVTFSGSKHEVDARAVVALSLVLHELGTNAAKYGALSADGGKIDISWKVVSSPQQRLQLVWRETGGPDVTVPSLQGFGSKLIRGLATSELQGTVDMQYARDGLICTLEFPLAERPAT